MVQRYINVTYWYLPGVAVTTVIKTRRKPYQKGKMFLEQVYSNIRKRAGGRCEWVDKVREGYRFVDRRCDEIEWEKAKNYKGTVHLRLCAKTKTLKETEETRFMLCWKHLVQNDKKLHKQVKPRPKKQDPDQLNLMDLV